MTWYGPLPRQTWLSCRFKTGEKPPVRHGLKNVFVHVDARKNQHAQPTRHEKLLRLDPFLDQNIEGDGKGTRKGDGKKGRGDKSGTTRWVLARSSMTSRHERRLFTDATVHLQASAAWCTDTKCRRFHACAGLQHIADILSAAPPPNSVMPSWPLVEFRSYRQADHFTRQLALRTNQLHFQ